MNVKEIAPLPHGWGTEMRPDSPESIVTKGFPLIRSKSTARNPITPPVGMF